MFFLVHVMKLEESKKIERKKKIEELKEEERKKNEKSHTFLQKMNKLRNSKEFIRCEGISICV